MSGSARGGSDWLDGGPGNDALYGDCGLMHDNTVGGADVFVFAPGSDGDQILDFENDKDVLDLRGFATIDRFSQVRAQVSEFPGIAISIDLGAAAGDAAEQDTVLLRGFDIADLSARDFLFA